LRKWFSKTVSGAYVRLFRMHLPCRWCLPCLFWSNNWRYEFPWLLY